MQSSVEQLEGLARKFTVELPAEQIDLEVEKRLKKVRSSARLDGFRPGKVPPQIIKQKYGASVRQDVIGELVEQSYTQALQEIKDEFEFADSPEIEFESGFNEGEPLKYAAIFEIMPEVNVQGMDSIAIELPKTTVTNDDLEQMIDILRRQRATFTEKADKVAEKDDLVTVDFIGKIDNEVFEGGSGEDVKFQIGAGQMLPDFENGVKGSKVGEEKTFSVTFPEDYNSEALAGKTAQFTVTVKKIEEMQLPEITDEFVKSFGVSDKEKFSDAIRENMTRELENALRNIKLHRMYEAILSNNSEQIVPNVLVKKEIQRLAEEMDLEKQIPDKKQRDELAEKFFAERALRNVRLTLLLGKLFRDSNLTLDDKRLQDRIDSIAASYEDPEELKVWYKNDKQARSNLESAILQEQLIDKLYESAAITYEDKNFREVMAMNQLRD